MLKVIPMLLAAAALGLVGCNDNSTSPRDVTPPAAPRGLYSVTGDHQATLSWLANTESDLAGYRVYEAPCASGSNCPYDRIGATAATQYVATGLTNGVTRFFAVSAVDAAGNESDLSYEDVFDTPRPAGSTALNNGVVNDTLANIPGAGWDFSAFAKVSSSMRRYMSNPTACTNPDCSAPSRFPAPRISRSLSAIRYPAPSSV